MNLDKTTSVDFSFYISSKGGGQTGIRVEISYKDLKDMLFNIAKLRPESASLFARATVLALDSDQ